MKIGFDAKWFFDGPPSGRMVVTNQVQALVALDSGHDLYLFLDARARGRDLTFDHPRLHRVYVWGDNNLVANLWQVPHEARRLGLDVVIFHNFTPLRVPFARVAYIHDIIFASHPEFYTWKERAYFRPLRELARRAERICTPSRAERERIIRHGYGRPEAVDVVYHGVHGEFRPRNRHDPRLLADVAARHGLPARFLLFVGRLNVRKNLRNLLRAIPLLRDQKISLVIVGARDWKMFDLDALVGELGLRSRLVLTGPLPGPELAAVYALGALFCFPSFEEGFGLPPLEAMASGVPVVVSDRSSLPEICGEAGSYADPDDPVAIARAIDVLLADPALAQRKRALGLERARRFTWEASARGLLESALAAAAMRSRSGR